MFRGNSDWFIAKAIWNGCVQWAGEAVVGLLPLFAYLLDRGFGANRLISALCNSQIEDNPLLSIKGNCIAVADSPLAEICVLSMVISGLSLLSTVKGRRQTPKNSLTYLMQLVAILSLVAGALFYAKITSHSNQGHDEWTYIALVAALVSSFVLAVQASVLETLRDRPQGNQD